MAAAGNAAKLKPHSATPVEGSMMALLHECKDAFLLSITRANCPKRTSMHGASGVSHQPAPIRAGRPQAVIRRPAASSCQRALPQSARRSASEDNAIHTQTQMRTHTHTQTPVSLCSTSGFLCVSAAGLCDINEGSATSEDRCKSPTSGNMFLMSWSSRTQPRLVTKCKWGCSHKARLVWSPLLIAF